MKIQLLSDLHIEFHQDRGAAWIDTLDSTDVDVLILAGDIAEVKDGLLSDVLREFTHRYPSGCLCSWESRVLRIFTGRVS